MPEIQNEQQKAGTVDQFKSIVANQYMKTIENFFADDQQALRFLSSATAAVQRNPKLLDCCVDSLMNSFMTMAQLKLLPSDVSGEAYIIPYNTKNGQLAQFQLGYQGLVTLFYRSGLVKDIKAEIVFEKDKFEMINGCIRHQQDPFSDDRGEPKGAYVIVRLRTGGEVVKAMSQKEILQIAKKYSKSYKSSDSPWKQDPQLWMWKKTVLKQCAKLVPKNPMIMRAIAEDNSDSTIENRAQDKELKQLTMGAIEVPPQITTPYENKDQEGDETAPKQDIETQAEEASDSAPEDGREAKS